MPGFLSSSDLASLRAEADRLWELKALFETRGAVPNSPERSDRLDPVIDLSEPFRALASDPRLQALARELLGGEAQLLKDKFIAKPSGAKGYEAHQDGAYWQGLGIGPDRFLTAALFLDDCPAEKGAIECASGLHSALLTDAGEIADLDDTSVAVPFEAVEAEAGDLLMLHSLTPHRSGPNRSPEMRRTVLFSYGRDSRPDLYDRYQALRRMGTG